MGLRLVFMGTPDFAVPTLARLIEDGHKVLAVYSQPPRPAGRGMAERPSPVQAFAERVGIEMRMPVALKPEAETAAFRALAADAAIVAAYGLLLPAAILAAPMHGCYNVHASLLPRWRGAAPINRAIMAGDRESGVSIMRMEEGLDTGPVCLMGSVPIQSSTTAGELHDRLAGLGAELMSQALKSLGEGALDCRPQPEAGVSYARKIEKSETRIDFDRPAEEVARHIHGLSPFPGAWFLLRGHRIKVLRAETAAGRGRPGTAIGKDFLVACRPGAVRLLAVQREGKSPLSAAEFARGTPVPEGTDLSGGG